MNGCNHRANSLDIRWQMCRKVCSSNGAPLWWQSTVGITTVSSSLLLLTVVMESRGGSIELCKGAEKHLYLMFIQNMTKHSNNHRINLKIQ